MYRWLIDQVKEGKTSIVHSHGLWQMPNVYPGWATKHCQTPLVISPRGMLSTWALNYSKWSKRVFWSLVQGPAISHAACFHATAESEYEDIRRMGLQQPVSIVPNGIDVPEYVEKPDHANKTLLFLGRIHPKKGIDNLLRAWAAVMDRHLEWSLCVAGVDEIGYLNHLRVLARELKLKRVKFTGPLFGIDKLTAYRMAHLYVLPTHSENFGMTVAEALAAGTPAIVTKGAPWAGLEQHHAGWWIDVGLDPLVACLERALACTLKDLVTMGLLGRRWMLQDYSWEKVGSMMHGTYLWLEQGGETPRWVRTE